MPFRSLARTLGQQRWFARLGRAMVPADRLVARLTGGRLVALGMVSSLLLTATGRHSGLPRTTPLLAVPDEDSFVVIGSNWGGPRQPAWALNLLANPEATIHRRGKRVAVRAQLLTGEERERAWRLALREWPAYQHYAERAGDRELHVFRLARTDGPGAAEPPRPGAAEPPRPGAAEPPRH